MVESLVSSGTVKTARRAGGTIAARAPKLQPKLPNGVTTVAEASTFIARKDEPGNPILKGTRRFSDTLMTAEGIGFMGGGLLASVGSLGFRHNVRKIAHMPFEALRTTSIGEWHKLPANYHKAVAADMEHTLLKRAARQEFPKAKFNWKNPIQWWEARGARNNSVKEFIKTKIELKNVSSQAASEAAGVTASVSALEGVSLNGIKGAEALQQVHEAHLDKANLLHKNASKPQVAKQLQGVWSSAKSHVKDGLSWLEQTKIGKQKLGEGAASFIERLPEWNIFKGIKNGKTLTGATASLYKSAKGVSIYGAVITAGVLAALGISHAASRKKGAAAHQALQEIVMDLGGETSAFYQNIKHSYTGRGAERALGHTMNAAGEIVNGYLMVGGGMKMLPIGMALPMIGKNFVGDSPTLNAYANLKQAELGNTALATEQKVNAMRVLLAAAPDVAAHGGYYNPLAQPLAQALVEKNLSLRQTMQLIANPTQLKTLAAEVSETANARAATPKTEALSAEQVKATNSAVAEAQAIIDQKPKQGEAAPHSMIAGGVQHHGRVVTAQRAAAV